MSNLKKNIKFKKVTMNNFMCHEFMEYDFSENKLSFISGDNGKGKTTIIDSVVYSLYGQTTKGKSGDDVIRRKSKKDCSVIFEFDINDDEYRIETYRKHHKHNNSKFIYKNGEDKTGIESKDTKKYIETILFPMDIFVNTILFSQYIKNPFASSTNSEKKKMLDKMLGLEQYDEYLENIKNNIKYTVSNIDKLSDELKIHNIHKNNELEIIDNLKNKLVNVKDDSKHRYELCSNELNVIKEKLKSLTFDENEYNRLIINKDNLLTVTGELKSRLTSSVDSYKKEESSLKESYEHSKKEVQNNHEISMSHTEKELDESKELNVKKSNLEVLFNDNKNRIENKIKDENNKISEYHNKFIKPLESDLKIIENNANNCKKNKNNYSTQIENVIDQIKKFENSIESDNKVCHVCKQILVDEQSLKHYEDEKIKLEKEKYDLEQKVYKLIKELDDYTSEYKSKNKLLKSKLDEYEKLKQSDTISKLKDELNILEKDYNKECKTIEKQIQNIISTFEVNKQACSRQTEIKLQKLNFEYEQLFSDLSKKYKDENIEVQESYNKNNIEIKNIELKINEIMNIQKEINSLTIEMKNKENEMKNIKNQCSNEVKVLNNELESRNIKLETFKTSSKELEEKIKLLNQKKEIQNFWKKAFGDTGIKAVILDESIPTLNAKAKELCSLINNLTVRFDSQVTLSSGENRNKFAINVLQLENLSTYEELSAGETRIANIIILLCLRHLLEVMNNCTLNVLLFDECLDSLDVKNSEIIMEMIKNLSNNYCVLLISHTMRDSIEADEYLNL